MASSKRPKSSTRPNASSGSTTRKVLIEFGADLRDPQLRDLQAAPYVLHQVINFFTHVYAWPCKPEEVLDYTGDTFSDSIEAENEYNRRIWNNQAKRQLEIPTKVTASMDELLKHQLMFWTRNPRHHYDRWLRRESAAGRFLVDIFRRPNTSERQPLLGQAWTSLANDWYSLQTHEEKVEAFRSTLKQEYPLVRYTIGHLLRLLRITDGWSSEHRVSSLEIFAAKLERDFMSEFELASGRDNFLSFGVEFADEVFHDPNTSGQCYHRCYDCLYTHVFKKSPDLAFCRSSFEGRNRPLVLEQLTDFLTEREVTIPQLESPYSDTEVQELEEKITRAFPLDVGQAIEALVVAKEKAIELAVGLLKRFLKRNRESLLHVQELVEMTEENGVLWPEVAWSENKEAVVSCVIEFLRKIDGFNNLEGKRVMEVIGSCFVQDYDTVKSMNNREQVDKLIKKLLDGTYRVAAFFGHNQRS